MYPGYYGTVGFGRFQSFTDRFLQTSSWKRSGTARIFPVQYRPESGGKEPVGTGKNHAGTESDFNGFSRRNDRPGISGLRINYAGNVRSIFLFCFG
ncbi:unnamed protein product [Adineta ricciae]|uniref:Uncharacterized protein n=1 Tax=Adineta ricciae TaxID=249248 RepID=A0A815P0G8_ADIRI|nr:unnamed protein product [Adineta ricciae]